MFAEDFMNSKPFFYEKIPTSIYASANEACKAVADEMAKLIREKQQAGEKLVLGLATGSTPKKVYAELIQMHQKEGLSFGNVICFNLDEYFPLQRDALQSYRKFMQDNFFQHVDIKPENCFIPDGNASPETIKAQCEEYEKKIKSFGGIDFQLLGIGRNGHIGFNEPGSGLESRTRLITLDSVTRSDAASDFFGEWNVPRQA
jgi:glucosamine-6-phosphate deaminase